MDRINFNGLKGGKPVTQARSGEINGLLIRVPPGSRAHTHTRNWHDHLSRPPCSLWFPPPLLPIAMVTMMQVTVAAESTPGTQTKAHVCACFTTQAHDVRRRWRWRLEYLRLYSWREAASPPVQPPVLLFLSRFVVPLYLYKSFIRKHLICCCCCCQNCSTWLLSPAVGSICSD